MDELFGTAPDLEAMRRFAVQMIVGGADAHLETWEITHQPGAPRWMEDANDAGATRPERLESLRRNFAAHGIDAQLEIVPGVSHDAARVVPRVQSVFARTLRRMRAPAAEQAA